ncbi:MAG: deoxynucleoside kinase [Lachnospiraceae bacterium]|nr:deoxynucleoside kinase [Lachnospiraceae bacterium]
MIIAIDGRSGGGKSTLAGTLEKKLGLSVVHMDDFFLQPHQRCVERLSQPGGNVDYERVLEEVLEPLKRGESPVTYRCFDCKTMSFGETKTIDGSKPVVVEGSYSCHPKLKEYYDLTIFLDVDGETQIQRLRERVGEERLQMFKEKWIPLEEAYFEAFRVKENCDIQK